jgi:hypothetical protein
MVLGAVVGLLGCGGGSPGARGTSNGDAAATAGDGDAAGDLANAVDAPDDQPADASGAAGAGADGGADVADAPLADGAGDATPGNDGVVLEAGVDVAPPVLDAGTILADPGRVAAHRLSNLEYDNTMRDLLGYTGNVAQTTFLPDQGAEFDNAADNQSITDISYEQYFNAADAIVEEVFSSASLAASRAKIMTCTPSVSDATCTRTIIEAFGPRAWRRPLSSMEVDGLLKVATDAIAINPDAVESVKQVIKTMLASPPFLLHIEIDPDPTSAVPHSLTPYELASRLSYFVWSSMPDDTLFALAASDAIWTDETLVAQVDRMLADPKATSFTQSFAGQWLGVRDLLDHSVEPSTFPTFTDALRTAMANEELSYFDEFLTGTLPMTQFLSADVNFVDATLATHYGFAPPAAGTVRVVNTTDARTGFLGLAGFLTATSSSYRTSPTHRGLWVLRNLLCQIVPSDPPGVPPLDPPGAESSPTAQGQNVRLRLTAHRAAADCAACHAALDPIGFGLESFDAIGAFRTTYGGGSPVDSSGMLATGETFAGLLDLANVLSSASHISQLTACTSQKMLTYALERTLVSTDQPFLMQIQTSWAAQGSGLRDLMKDVVLNGTFRFRRGEP